MVKLTKQEIRQICTDHASCDASNNFPSEVSYLMKKHKVSRSAIRIDAHHPCGEDCIFIKKDGVEFWGGYIDDQFYEEMNS